MSTKKTITSNQSYKARITKTQDQLLSETVDLTVELTQNALKQGILSLESKVIASKSEVGLAKGAVAEANRKLEAAKSVTDHTLFVQGIVDAKIAVEQAEANAATAEEEHAALQRLHNYLVETQTELFGTLS